MGLLSKAQQIALAVLLALLTASMIFGGWNWYRKNVYYDALHQVAAEKLAKTRQAEADLRTKLTALETNLNARSKTREDTLDRQLADAARSQSMRVEYRLRDRWLPVSCPAGAGPGDRQESAGGLQPEDEQFLVRESGRADNVADQLNACIDAYELARQTALKANK